MSRIDIGELEALLAVSSRMRDGQVKELNQLKAYLNEFLAEQQLKGTAVDSTKRYYETGYIPLLKATVHTLDLLIEKIEAYIRHFYEDVDHTGGRLDSQLLMELEDKIGRYERDVESLKQRMSAVSEAEITPKMAKLHDSIFSLYKEKDILNKYLAFEERHRTFFSEIESISYNLQSGLRELAEKVSFTDIHKGYDISGLSKYWQEFVQKKNKEFDELEKAGGKEAERLKEYTIIKCVDPLTGKVTWAIEKNGLGVIDPGLQAYLDKVGDGLSKKDYDILEITPKEWAERVNNAWKRNGTDYFSGNQYGGWLSALAHGQDFMDGIKESGVYDALWGLGTLASAVRNMNKMNQKTIDPNFEGKQAVSGEQWHKYFKDKYGADNVQWETAVGSINEIIDMPSLATRLNPSQLAELAEKSGWKVTPLKKGSSAGIPYNEGGGFSMNAPDGSGSSRYIQYHPGSGHHGDLPYYKISTPDGTTRIDINGKVIE